MRHADRDWFSDEDFWSESYAFMFPDERFEEAKQQVDSLITLTGCMEGKVLDLCCGPGRHTIPLARRGFTVTAVDSSPLLLQRAQEYAAREKVEVEWVRRDMREFSRADAFDLAINMFTSFGFFDDPADNLKVLRNVHKSLKPGGSSVIDVVGKEIIASKYQPTAANELPDGRLMVERRKVSDEWSRIDNDWLFIDEGQVRSFHLRLWLYSGRELRQLLESVGFTDIDIIGSFDGSPYGPDASRLIGVARKPA